MATVEPVSLGLGELVIAPRPHTAPCTTRSATHTHKHGESRQTAIQSDRARSANSTPDELPPLEEVEALVRWRLRENLAKVRSALRSLDPKGRGSVGRDEFRRVLKTLLSLRQNQLNTLLNEVCERNSVAVDYMRFLRRYSRAPAARRASSRSSMRRGPENTSMPLSEIQKHLKDKIGGNLRTVIRVFRLFDYNREGRIQQHEFRRILDNYCLPLTDKEFQRLWNYYSPNNMASISYKLFLDKLGFGNSKNFNIVPVCTKLELSSQGITPSEKVKQKKQRPASQAGSGDAPPTRGPTHGELQDLFHQKMCANSTPVWQTLQAFDATHSGLVKRDVLRAVLSNFLFPMNPHTFQKLTSRASEHPNPEEAHFDLQDIYSRLKEIFRLLNRAVGWITRSDLRLALEVPQCHLINPKSPGGTDPQLPRPPRPRLSRSQVGELLNMLDPEHTGVVQLPGLERLNPSIASAPVGRIAPPPSPTTAEPPDVTEETEETVEEQNTSDERQTAQWADKVSLASVSWRTVESLLLDKLCEQISSVLAALKLCDPQQTGYVKQEDLKKVILRYGMPISHTHFKKQSTPPQTAVRGQRPSSSLAGGPSVHSILDIVLRRIREKLEERHTTLADRIQATTHSSDGTLSERDLRKILEDSWITLDDKYFYKLTDMLGFKGGRIERSVLQAKYEDFLARDRKQSSEGRGGKDEADAPLPTAEEILATMKTRIKIAHGNNLTAFRLMDKNGDGVVDCHDFKELYNSLGLVYREREYQRLLHLIGLHPGGNLNYAEFFDVVENDGKRKQQQQTASVQDQLHEQLASNARDKWAAMSKALCRFDAEGQGLIFKKGLRYFLFTYDLPLRLDEFEQLWSRYDPEGRGCVTVADFLDRLGVHQDGESGPRSRKIPQQDADKPVSSDAASLEHIERILQDNYEGVSSALTRLDKRSDGTVKVDELLNLLRTYGCSVQRDQLIRLLRRLKVSMDDTCRKLAYLDFLSAFDHKTEKKCDELPPAPPDAVRQIETLDGLSPGHALARIRELVTASAPNLYKAFSVFDPCGTGTVEALDFRQVLENFCARLSDNQYRYMLNKLELNWEHHTINWKAFLNKFKPPSPLVQQDCPGQLHWNTQADGTAVIQRRVLEERMLGRCLDRGTKARSPTETSRITEVLRRIQEVVSGRLYEITKEVMDLDQTHSDTISKDEFRQLCDRRFMRLTSDQFECVWNQMPVNEEGKLQYREFLKRFGAEEKTTHTEPGSPTNNILFPSPEPREIGSSTKSHRPKTAGVILQRCKSAPQCSSRRSSTVGGRGTGSPLGNVERRLRGEVQRCWKEIQRNCSEEDPHREGEISTKSFLDTLQSLNISVTQKEFEHLAVKFDIMSNGRVSYPNFLRHFLLNLNPPEVKWSFERRKLPRPATMPSRGVLSRQCVEVMLRIYEAVQLSWNAIRHSFLTSDRARTGHISIQDFRKVLRHFSVSLSEEEFFHLSSYFDASAAGKISYNDFLRAFLR
ncbi:EF-hand calcium-binding domain-containing protein 6 [Centroberyx gerrardi]